MGALTTQVGASALCQVIPVVHFDQPRMETFIWELRFIFHHFVNICAPIHSSSPVPDVMAPQVPSIQSFFQPEVPSPQAHQQPKHPQTCNEDAGDGFTSSEIEATLHPTLHKWQPRVHYEETSIGDLEPGPACVALMGRIVNFYDQATPSKMPHAAKGCIKIIVKDDSGALTVSAAFQSQETISANLHSQVKVWYANIEYQLRLGHLVSIWTPHISNTEPGSMTLQDASLVTSIFPERDNTCYFMIQEKSDEGVLCKTPLGYRDGKQLGGLITLKNFVDDGHEITDSKVLVCVKSIGGRKKCRCSVTIRYSYPDHVS